MCLKSLSCYSSDCDVEDRMRKVVAGESDPSMVTFHDFLDML
jgi:hypothetical protein